MPVSRTRVPGETRISALPSSVFARTSTTAPRGRSRRSISAAPSATSTSTGPAAGSGRRRTFANATCSATPWGFAAGPSRGAANSGFRSARYGRSSLIVRAE